MQCCRSGKRFPPTLQLSEQLATCKIGRSGRVHGGGHFCYLECWQLYVESVKQPIKVNDGETFFHQQLGHVPVISKTYFTKISVSGGPCIIHFCFFLWAYYSFSFLIVITARRFLKLDMLATSFDIPATICSLVFYCVSLVATFRLLFNYKMEDSNVSNAI